MQMLAAIVEALGQRHASYGVIAEHYRLVEQALLWALAQELGARWTAEVEAAWQSAYTLLAATMEAAASRVNLAPPGATERPTDQDASHQSPHRVSDPS